MSGVMKKIGKVFKKVAKVLKKVAIPALMIGAVVLTGGAALGLLPSVGAMVGTLGLSTGVASVITGAVTSGAIGAGLGALSGAVTGGGVLKGATKGFVGGAISGGVLGAVSPSSVAGLDKFIGGKGLAAGSSAAQAAANAGSVMNTGMANSLARVGASLPNVATGGLSSAGSMLGSASSLLPSSAAGGSLLGSIGSAGSALVPAAAKTGIGGFLGQNAGSLISTVGSAIGGLGQGKAQAQQSKDEAMQRRTAYDRSAYNYGFINDYASKKSPLPSGQRQSFQYADPLRGGIAGGRVDPTQGLTGAVGASPYYQIVNGKVMLVQGNG